MNLHALHWKEEAYDSILLKISLWFPVFSWRLCFPVKTSLTSEISNVLKYFTIINLEDFYLTKCNGPSCNACADTTFKVDFFFPYCDGGHCLSLAIIQIKDRKKWKSETSSALSAWYEVVTDAPP